MKALEKENKKLKTKARTGWRHYYVILDSYLAYRFPELRPEGDASLECYHLMKALIMHQSIKRVFECKTCGEYFSSAPKDMKDTVMKLSAFECGHIACNACHDRSMAICPLCPKRSSSDSNNEDHKK